MAAPALVVRIAANLDELKRNMLESTSHIETTRNALSKMASSYDGSKIIQQAHATVAAIQQVGGVTTLTSAEQVKANAVIQQAIEKYRVLGKEAPAGLREMADATRQVEQPTSMFSGTIGKLTAALGAYVSIRSVVNFAHSAMEDASALQDLSNQTQVSVEDIQILQAAMREFGVDGAELGRALFQLSRRIAKDDESVEKALFAMGLSIDTVRDKRGIELLSEIQHGLSTLDGSLRDTAAAELYGEKLGASMAGASKGFDDAVDRARRFNTFMSTEAVQALDEYGEAIERTETNLTNLFLNAVGPFAQGLNVMIETTNRGASGWDVFKAAFFDAIDSLSGVEGGVLNLTRVIDENNRAQEESAAASKRDAAAKRDQSAAVATVMTAYERAAIQVKLGQAVWGDGMAAAEKATADFWKAVDQLNARLIPADQLLGKVETTLQPLTEKELLAAHGFATMAEYAKVAARDIDGTIIPTIFKTSAQLAAMTAQAQMAAFALRQIGMVSVSGPAGGNYTDVGNVRVSGEAKFGEFAGVRYTLPDPTIPGMFGRASGGPVSAGQPYVVGERRPELFVPDRNGTILPSVGGTTVVNHFHITQPLGTPREIARVVGDALMRSGGRRAPSGA